MILIRSCARFRWKAILFCCPWLIISDAALLCDSVRNSRLGRLIHSLQEITARVKVAETHSPSHKCRLERWRPQEHKILTPPVSHTSWGSSFLTWSMPDNIPHILQPERKDPMGHLVAFACSCLTQSADWIRNQRDSPPQNYAKMLF